jgi:hypothetical protein
MLQLDGLRDLITRKQAMAVSLHQEDFSSGNAPANGNTALLLTIQASKES